jgi:hypothetical protein
VRYDGDDGVSNFTREKTYKIISTTRYDESKRERERKRESRVDGDERDRREKLMNNLKRENTF